MRGDRERRDEIFEEWLLQLSEDERSTVERGSPPKKLRQKFLAFCKTLSEEEQRAIVRRVSTRYFNDNRKEAHQFRRVLSGKHVADHARATQST